MPLEGAQTFVGFGFGPIQAGVFVLEAFRTGRFGRLVVAEVVPEVVRTVRDAGGQIQVNVAHSDRIETIAVGPLEVEDPSDVESRKRLLDAIVEASEVATAVPSVGFYRSDRPGSIHRVLAEGLRRRFAGAGARESRPVVVYAAENHNRAAEVLEDAVLSEIPAGDRDVVRSGVQFLNTVIGKMSGVVEAAPERGLVPITPKGTRAFLVESFRRILVSRIRFAETSGFRRGIDVFQEKLDLLPFEEAKLYGHNAAHALAAYIARELGLQRMDELRGHAEAGRYVHAAFVEESGGALRRKWAEVDELFTESGYRAYVDDLMERMLNPFLGDLVERVARDPARKLGWDDRVIGTIRMALSQGIRPVRFALGAALALQAHAPATIAPEGDPAVALDSLWSASRPNPAERAAVLETLYEGLKALRAWRRTGTTPWA